MLAVRLVQVALPQLQWTRSAGRKGRERILSIFQTSIEHISLELEYKHEHIPHAWALSIENEQLSIFHMSSRITFGMIDAVSGWRLDGLRILWWKGYGGRKSVWTPVISGGRPPYQPGVEWSSDGFDTEGQTVRQVYKSLLHIHCKLAHGVLVPNVWIFPRVVVREQAKTKTVFHLLECVPHNHHHPR